MAGQDRAGGAFFANGRKANDNAPDYRGELRLDAETVDNLIAQRQSGVQFPAIELAGWKKTSGSGTVYISLSGKKPFVKTGQQGGGYQQQQQQRPQQGGYSNGAPQGGYSNNAMDDEIPF